MQDQNQHSLKNGTTLYQYKIIRVLGAGGFGITYLAQDIQLGMQVVIKEYFPNEFAIRTNNSTIISKTSADEAFSKGLQRFQEEAKTLAKFNHPSIVKILGYFEANHTGYFIMEYEEGIDLSQYLKQKNEPFTQEEILGIIMPILEGLKEVHKYKYLHRDIKPGNILLRNNKSPVLIDFGASKLAIGEASRSITSMLTEGYAPLEQYSTDIKHQGSFTDLYAVGAVIYKMITGEVPPSAQTRSYQLLQNDSDPYISLLSLNLAGYDKSFLLSVDKVLQIKAKNRPQNVQEFQSSIVGALEPELEKKDSHILNKNENENVFLNFFLWKGKINRSEFLGHFFLYFVLLMFGSIFIPKGGISAIFGVVFIVFGIWIGLMSVVKRARDMQENIVIVMVAMFIPYINFITLLILLLKPGKLEMNKKIKSEIDHEQIFETLKDEYTFLSKHFVREKGTLDDFMIKVQNNNIQLIKDNKLYQTYPIKTI